MAPAFTLPLALLLGGLVKAVAILWAGPKLGVPMLAVLAIAILWVVGPAGGALWWRRRVKA